MPPNKPHHLPLELPLWRTFCQPAQKRWWRCRPTLAGIELGFRDDDTVDWSSRIIERTHDLGQPPMPGEDDYREREVAREAALIAVVRRALELVAEQVADGFVEQSRDAGTQLWQALPSLWRKRVDVDVAPLVLAQEAIDEPTLHEVVAWLVDASGYVKHTKIANGFGSTATPSWWSPITGDAHTSALVALRANADRVIAGCVLSLAMPGLTADAAKALEGTLLAATRLSDDVPIFDALCALMLSASRPPIGLPKLVTHLCNVTDARVERLASVLHTEDAARENAALTLALWSSNQRAFAALLEAARRRVLVEAVLRAVEIAPRIEWLEVLQPAYHQVHSSRRGAIDAAIDACKDAHLD